MNEFTYAGSELHLFAKAVHWKAYWLSQLLPFVRGEVLEVGAGMGANTRWFQDGGYQRWVCLEPDANLCHLLRVHVEGLRAVEARVGMLTDMAPEECFDTIIYLDVLEHIEDDGLEMCRAAAHLRPGGCLLVLSPAHQRLYTPFDAAIGHFRRYSRATLRAAAPPELQLVRLRYLDSVGMLASLGNRMLLKQSMPNEKQIHLWDSYMVPVSRCLDPLLGYRVGKSIAGVWRKAPA